jgi:hypothetical protein
MIIILIIFNLFVECLLINIQKDNSSLESKCILAIIQASSRDKLMPVLAIDVFTWIDG